MDAILYVTEQIRLTLDLNEYAAVAFLDLSKAFDSMDHAILLSKLAAMGLNSQSLSMLECYLTGRFQRVKLASCTSDWLPTIKGVPQGTVLGPLLFAVYVADLSLYIDYSKISQYADDTCVFVSHWDANVAVQQLGHDVEKLTCYFRSHHLNLNVTKTEFILARKPCNNSKVDKLRLNVEGLAIGQTNSAKYLGVYIDNNLTFGRQVTEVLRRTACAIRTIYHIRDFLPKYTRISVMNAIVTSHFHYSALLLTSITQSNLDSLERQLNWALKASLFQSKFASVSNLKISTKTLGVGDIVQMKSLNYFFALYNNTNLPYKNGTFPGYILRTNSRTGIVSTLTERPRTNYMTNSFLQSAIRHWNALPVALRLVRSKNVFHKRCKEYIIRKFELKPHDRIMSNAWRFFRIHST